MTKIAMLVKLFANVSQRKTPPLQGLRQIEAVAKPWLSYIRQGTSAQRVKTH